MNDACTENRFLNDVSRHAMTVIRDDGVHRHIRFKRPESGTYWFDLITWPGSLCIDGDCGTYVFRRLDDMFEFFRTDREYLERKGCQLAINPGYWGEKLQATANFGGFCEFSESKFAERVREAFDEAAEDQPDEAKRAECWEEIEERVLGAENEYEAHEALRDFEFESFSFYETFEWDLTEYTFHFLWCCYAIAWGVKTYDEATAEVQACQS